MATFIIPMVKLKNHYVNLNVSGAKLHVKSEDDDFQGDVALQIKN